MKKLLSLCMAAAMLCTLCVPALAATINESTSQSTNTTVTYGVQVGYTITIPSAVTIGADGTGAVDYSVSNALIPAGENLYVTTDSANREDDTFYLTNVDESTVKIPYEIATNGIAWDNDMHTRTMVFPQEELSAGTATRAVTFRLLDDGHYSGTYTDILTTTVTVGYAVYGAYQFPEEDNFTWPENLQSEKYLTSHYEYDGSESFNYDMREDVRVFQSKTNEWADQLDFTMMVTYDTNGNIENLLTQLYTRVQGVGQTGLFEQATTTRGYWGMFEIDRLLYFGEEFQLVSKDFYEWLHTNTQPVNFFDCYEQLNGTYELSGDINLPDGDAYGVIDAGVVNNEYHGLVALRYDTYDIPLFVYTNIEDESDAVILYVEGIGWVEPTHADLTGIEDPALVQAFLTSLTPATTPSIVDFNDELVSKQLTTFFHQFATPIT